MIDKVLKERPNCPRCGKPLGFVDGSWICFTNWKECGVMMDGHFNRFGRYIIVKPILNKIEAIIASGFKVEYPVTSSYPEYINPKETKLKQTITFKALAEMIYDMVVKPWQEKYIVVGR